MQLRLTLTTTLTLLTTLCLLTACGDSAPSVPDTPDGTVKAVADGLANNNPRVVWAAMPESWQKDVDGVVDSFADAVDTEIYDKSFALISKLGDVLKNKKSLILELAKDEQAGRQLPLDASKIETNYDAVVSMVNTIAKSDLAKKDSLKSMNIGKFLGSTGASIMKDMDKVAKMNKGDENKWLEMKEKLKSMKVEVVKTEGDTATVKISAKGEEPSEEQMVKVDGKWVPKEIADEWDEGIQEAKEGIAEMTGEGMNKTQVLAQLSAMDSVLDQINKAETKEDLQEALGGIMMMMLGGMGGPGMGGPGGPGGGF